jgi:dTDP-glucose pyrophosphorylase
LKVRTSKVALILCGGDINFSDLPIITNKSNAMIPVNGKPVIGWILDDLLSKGVSEVILVVRFDNYKLFNYVEWAFATRVIVHYAFVQAGGTILHSLLAGLAWVRPGSGVHVVLGDTLVRDIFPDSADFIFAGEYENPEDWCLVKTDSNNVAQEYFDKEKIDGNNLKAVAGVYHFSDTDLLRNLVMSGIKNGAKEISHVLRGYGKHRTVVVVAAKEWYDFGHINYFNLAKRQLLQSRYFNTLEIDPVRGIIIKRSDKKEKLANELDWYKGLPAHLQLLSPRLVESKTSNGVAICQEYYGYPNLAELYVFGDIGLSVWMHALKRLMEIHLLFKNEKGKLDQSDIVEMYGNKTNDRLTELALQKPEWKILLSRDTLIINGKSYKNFVSLQKRVMEKVHQLGEKFEACIIHGDYCFSNILYDLNSQLVRLIDPRGSFGKQRMYGDPRYDIAKLRHSVSGRYDFIMADLFIAREHEAGSFELEFFKPEVYDSITSYFDTLIEEYSYNKNEVMFIEALLFISMVPLHRDNFPRQLAMYLNGIMLLNKVFHENRD